MEIKNKYLSSEMEIKEFDLEDIIVTSITESSSLLCSFTAAGLDEPFIFIASHKLFVLLR